MINSSILKNLSKSVLNKNQFKHLKVNFTNTASQQINIIYNVKKNQTLSSSSSSSLFNKNFTINSFNNYKNRFYSTNSNNNNSNNNSNHNNSKNTNNENNNTNNENNNSNNNSENKFNRENILNFLKNNKKNILYSFGIGLGVASQSLFGSSSIGIDDLPEKKVYYKFGKWEFTEKHLVIGSLIGANLIVFGLLKNFHFFKRYGYHFFCSASSINKYPASIILSTFTHTEPFHLLFNMYALSSFGSAVYDHMGTRDFLLLYFLGGLVGTMGSLTFKLVTGAFEIPSIGASGCIFSIIAPSVFLDSETRIGIMFLPVSFEGYYVLSALMFFDFLGCVIPQIAKKTNWDHACHLASAITGCFIGSLYPYKERFQNFYGTGKIITPNFIYRGEIQNGSPTGKGEYLDSDYYQRGIFKDGSIEKGEVHFRKTGQTRYFEKSQN
ncbi:hypothetical protein RB653_003871 [Dictyostelium firmibasis]|uniref:Peptidase S54 rhomboid domain-containing protein n=1 Tax=Dictyostelium firmibasis TaxID=79012 RepID=A0AAN7UIA3_9MYCE